MLLQGTSGQVEITETGAPSLSDFFYSLFDRLTNQGKYNLAIDLVRQGVVDFTQDSQKATHHLPSEYATLLVSASIYYGDLDNFIYLTTKAGLEMPNTDGANLFHHYINCVYYNDDIINPVFHHLIRENYASLHATNSRGQTPLEYLQNLIANNPRTTEELTSARQILAAALEDASQPLVKYSGFRGHELPGAEATITGNVIYPPEDDL